MAAIRQVSEVRVAGDRVRYWGRLPPAGGARGLGLAGVSPKGRGWHCRSMA